MSAQPLTYESVLELIRESNREIRESSREGIREIQKMRRLMKVRDAEYAREKQERDAEFDRLKKERDAENDRLKKEREAEYDRLKKERDAEIEKLQQKTELQMERMCKEVGNLGNNVGRLVEHMLGERIIEKFQALGYAVDDYVRNHLFSVKKLGIRGEIDLLLHDGDISILIEVKTTLDVADVRRHLERMEEYRVFANVNPMVDSSIRYLGAVAGAVVEDDALKFAHENGLYTIVQSGEAVEIAPVPEGFKAREW